MNPLLEEVLNKQVKTLNCIYYTILVCISGAMVASLFLGSDDSILENIPSVLWVELGLVAMGALVLGLALPIAYKRLTSIEKVKSASRKMLMDWGLPEAVPFDMGRQAVYLTRYTAGCILSWIMTASVGLYGLIARVLNKNLFWTALFFAGSLIVMLLVRPRKQHLKQSIEKLADT